ncbi:DnaJ-class molecular chaperone [Streptomyces eurocidicus]|uniref:DnaJ-class molecular chaperone n=1 Tax=Streptomyces eurocidicus TaxID=66423 RepID=A0A7W8F1R0_STREU|nr:DnaJ-class molecular chaperone [Streptomyces eurocidicus]
MGDTPCLSCNGTGYKTDDHGLTNQCDNCNGTGRVEHS